MDKYKFDRNDQGDFYIQKLDDPDASLMDVNRVIVEAVDLDQFLNDLLGFLTREFGYLFHSKELDAYLNTGFKKNNIGK